MENKLAFIDVETTGLNPTLHGIIDIGFIIADDTKDGVIELNRGNITLNPLTYKRPVVQIDEKALKINGKNLEEISTFKHAIEARRDLTDVLIQYIDTFKKNDNFTMVGYNVSFDMNFMIEFFNSTETFYYKFFNYQPICVMHLIKFLVVQGKIPPQNSYKLEYIAKSLLGIEIEAHKASADINATFELYKYCKGLINGSSK